jgi:hypothetical protein
MFAPTMGRNERCSIRSNAFRVEGAMNTREKNGRLVPGATEPRRGRAAATDAEAATEARVLRCLVEALSALGGIEGAGQLAQPLW